MPIRTNGSVGVSGKFRVCHDAQRTAAKNKIRKRVIESSFRANGCDPCDGWKFGVAALQSSPQNSSGRFGFPPDESQLL